MNISKETKEAILDVIDETIDDFINQTKYLSFTKYINIDYIDDEIVELILYHYLKDLINANNGEEI